MTIPEEQPDEQRWLSAAMALKLVESALGEGAQAREAIAARAHDGLVPTRATRLVKDGRPSDDVEVPKEFWWARGRPALQQNWVSGDFSTTINQARRWHAYGVRFQAKAIEAMLPEDGLGGVSEGGKRQYASVQKRGPPLSKLWPSWVAELVAHIHHHGWPDGQGSEGQEKLINTIADAFAARGEETLARATVQDAVQAVLDRLRSPGN